MNEMAEMKMRKTLVLVFLGIIIFILGFLMAQIVVMHNNSTDTEGDTGSSGETILQDNITLKNISSNDGTITEEYNITLNNKVSTLSIVFKETLGENYLIKGTINGDEVYYNFKSTDNHFTVDNIKADFNENNFQIIKGEDDKSYLLLQTYYSNYDLMNFTSTILVYNDDLNLISRNFLGESESPDSNNYNGFVIMGYKSNVPCGYESNPTYTYSFKNFTLYGDLPSLDSSFVKVENNKIYFLYPKVNADNYDESTLEERVYTINNGIINYSTLNTYKITAICAQS